MSELQVPYIHTIPTGPSAYIPHSNTYPLPTHPLHPTPAERVQTLIVRRKHLQRQIESLDEEIADLADEYREHVSELEGVGRD